MKDVVEGRSAISKARRKLVPKPSSDGLSKLRQAHRGLNFIQIFRVAFRQILSEFRLGILYSGALPGSLPWLTQL